MSEKNVRKENFEQAQEDLDELDEQELEEIGIQLEEIQDSNDDPEITVEDAELKKRIARICLKLMNETPKDGVSMMETAYIITSNFVWATYGDELDEAMDIAGELELPEEHVSGEVQEMWDRMKKILEDYLES
jgi:hypothetical protein